MKRRKNTERLWQRLTVIALLLLQLALIGFSLVSRSMASRVTSVSLTVLSIGVCFYIIAKREKEAYKLTWVFLIMLFPLFGGLFYLLFTSQYRSGPFSRRARRAEQTGRQLFFLPGSGAKKACRAYPGRAPLIKYLEGNGGFPLYGDTEVRYLTPGEEKFRCLVQELEKAQRYIFMEYFIIREGIMWDKILDILREKAADGVKVRLIFDDLGCFSDIPRNFAARLREDGIECVPFNPFRPVLTSVHNNRDHRKIAVIDGRVAFTGGVNIADEYINAYERFGHWKDASVMLEGRAAWSFTLMFLEMWELCTGTREDRAVYYPGYSGAAGTGFVQPYGDSPVDGENVGEEVYLSLINGARDYLYINTPYLIIDDGMVSALCRAAKSGVDVRIVTPHKWDKWAVHMTTRSYYRELIKGGVKIYEYTKGFIHSKTFVSDDEAATVGTVNLDYRSLYLHFECGAVLYGCDAVARIKEDFLTTLNSCQPITEQDCRYSLPLRMFQDLMRVFAPLL